MCEGCGKCSRHDVDAVEARQVYSALVAVGFNCEDLSGLTALLGRNNPAVTAVAASLMLAVRTARVEATVVQGTPALPGLEACTCGSAAREQLPLLAAQGA